MSTTVAVTLVANAQQTRRKTAVLPVPASRANLQEQAKNKLRLKATRFFAAAGTEIDAASLLRFDAGDSIFCSAGEDYVGVAEPATQSEILVAGCGVSSSSSVSPTTSTTSQTSMTDEVQLPGEKGAINWLRVGPGRLAMWHRPGGKAIAKLRRIAGATVLATLLAEREGAEEIGRKCAAEGLQWFWSPLDGADVDYLESEAACASMACAARFIRDRLRLGDSILLHCSAGIHRTGAVGYAALRASGLSADDAAEGLAVMRTVTAEKCDQAGAGRASGGGRLAIVERSVLPLVEQLVDDREGRPMHP
jgi:hypothetical protein